MLTPRLTTPRDNRRFISYAISAQLILLTLLSSVVFRSTPARAAPQEFTAQSAAGDLDPSFGVGGKVVTDFSGNDDGATAVAIQSDGKIIAAGSSTPQGGNPDFALARYNIDGGLDPSFGLDGKVTTDFFQDKDFLHAVAIQLDGKIVAAGSAVQPGLGSEFALARYNPDGSLDSGFGVGGKTATSFPDEAESLAVALTPSGKIIAVGTASTKTSPKFALARFNADGSLDQTFGADGKVMNSFQGGFDHGRAVALQPEGKIVVAGEDSAFTRSASPIIFRYNSNGSPDTAFGAAGGVIVEVFLIGRANAVAIQPDGKVVVAGLGVTNLVKVLFGIARCDPNGLRDGTFGDFGSLRGSISERDDGATAVALQTDRKILIAGFAGAQGDFTGSADFGLVRFKPKAKFDKTFGVGGKVITDFFGGADVANAMVLQSDGKIVLAGTARAATNVFALARYLVEDFSLGFEPPMLTAARGTTASVELLINRVGAGSVTVTSPDASAIGVKVKPASPISTTHARRSFNLKIESTAQVGVHQLTFKGEDDEGRVRTAAVRLEIR